MSLLPTTGLAIDAASGLLLVFLGLYLLRLRPRQARSTALAAFSASLGALFFLINLVSADDPLRINLVRIGWLFAIPATAALVLLVGRLALPPLTVPRREAIRQVAVRTVAAAVGSAVLVGVLLEVLPGTGRAYGLERVAPLLLLVGVLAGRAALSRLSPELRSATLAAAIAAAAAGGHAMAGIALNGAVPTGNAVALASAVLLNPPSYALLIGGFLYALLLLALRWGDLARASEGAGERRFAVSATVALMMYPGLAVGLVGHPWTYHVFLLAGFLAVPAAWLRNAHVARPPEARTARNVALLTLGLVVLGAAALRFFGTSSIGAPFAVDAGPLGIARVATVGALTYIVLRRQLFDIDVKVKRAVAQGLIASAFVGAFILGVQGSAALGAPTAAPVAGLAAMGLLGLALAALQGWAERLADAVLPGVEDSAAYLNMRRLEVYRAALEQSHMRQDGTNDTPQLAALREELSISERDHAVLVSAVRSPARGGAWLGPGDLVLGRYRVAGFLGEGAHGRTYLADDTASGARVVLKSIHPDRGAEALLREVRALRALQHPNVVALHEVELVDGAVIIVMEALEGSLGRRLDTGALAPAEFARVADGLLAALEAVHAAGIVHRDVKPSNVLLTASGEAKLADFGIAHLPGLETTVGGAGSSSAAGTIKYMSPEQAKGKKVTARSDLFSAAATLYEAYAGKALLEPGPRESPMELQMRAAKGQPFRGRVQPKPLQAWFARALDPDPARRFASAAAMREALLRAWPETVEPATLG